MQNARYLVLLLIFAGFGLTACGGGEEAGSDAAATEEAAPAASDVSIEAQIGPITELELGAYDAALASEGEAAFAAKCSTCHRMDSKVIGPALGDTMEKRSPVYVMNMIMNPTEMLESHPVAKALLADYMGPMVPLGIDEAEARSIVEYLRTDG